MENPELTIARKAKQALKKIAEKDEISKEFKSYLQGLPSNIIQNGLVQTIAFIGGKTEKDKKYKYLYDSINTFFNEYFNVNTGSDLLSYLTDNLQNLSTYVYYQKGILSFSVWLKRYAMALYPEKTIEKSS